MFNSTKKVLLPVMGRRSTLSIPLYSFQFQAAPQILLMWRCALPELVFRASMYLGCMVEAKGSKVSLQCQLLLKATHNPALLYSPCGNSLSVAFTGRLMTVRARPHALVAFFLDIP